MARAPAGRGLRRAAAALGRIGHLRSDMAEIDGAVPVIVQPPAIAPAAGPVGTAFTLIPPLAEGAPIPAVSLGALTLAGVDVRAQVTGRRIVALSPGALIAVWHAANGVLPHATAAAVAEVAPDGTGGFSRGFGAGFNRI
ncbi:hypothetical protein [Albidovulum sp.]|uniref:hypothetical protein n=1 Tax=Albidovulum sp. TaxID=1872424 RepID=UPI0039B9C9D7